MTDGHLVTRRRRDVTDLEAAKAKKSKAKKSHYRFQLPAKSYKENEVCHVLLSVGECFQLSIKFHKNLLRSSASSLETISQSYIFYSILFIQSLF